MKRYRFFLWVIFYVLCHNGPDMAARSFQGMSKTTVERLLKQMQMEQPGMTYEYVTRAAYRAQLVKLQNDRPLK